MDSLFYFRLHIAQPGHSEDQRSYRYQIPASQLLKEQGPAVARATYLGVAARCWRAREVDWRMRGPAVVVSVLLVVWVLWMMVQPVGE